MKIVIAGGYQAADYIIKKFKAKQTHCYQL